MKLPWTKRQTEPEAFDYADAERRFTASHRLARTQSGALALETDTGWRSLMRGELDRWVHDYLIEKSISRLWTTDLVESFSTFLAAGAESLPKNAKLKNV